MLHFRKIYTQLLKEQKDILSEQHLVGQFNFLHTLQKKPILDPKNLRLPKYETQPDNQSLDHFIDISFIFIELFI